ncbi:Gas vesicle synthesis protein GvpL/GvpF [Sinosporangium album]|uniref:Gas vesicle synthesis protein GvpL/GvpF n=1 Tax=Sinosporangium album TaxID=504805 RepID=A0A1G8C6R2_9ACTN|nr:GvpL/GvpF family gas vesicle protein [Sinosporangium album]SDH41052.1 Gas vesicle synthesis protein GvpL/GvpF [Sinosporangium album]
MADEAGTYLYAVALDVGGPPPRELTGVAGEAVRTITRGGLAAYVSSVPLSEFGEEPLRQSMEDLGWLSRTARAHHRVVEAVSRAAPTAPVRLVTVYSGEKQVEDLLERRHDDFHAMLTGITGRDEWGVKVYAEAKAAAESPAKAAAEPPAPADVSAGPGTAYLKRRQANLRDRDDERRRAAASAEGIHQALTSFAVASRLHHTQDPQLSGHTEWMVLNGAYLVDHDRGAEFARLVRDLSGPGIEVELTGPWAPYSFTVLDDTPEEADPDEDR